jgi:hypothetical protein
MHPYNGSSGAGAGRRPIIPGPQHSNSSSSRANNAGGSTGSGGGNSGSGGSSSNSGIRSGSSSNGGLCGNGIIGVSLADHFRNTVPILECPNRRERPQQQQPSDTGVVRDKSGDKQGAAQSTGEGTSATMSRASFFQRRGSQQPPATR